MRTNVVPKSHHCRGAMQKVLVHVLTEYYFLFHRDHRIEIHLQNSRPFASASHLYAQLSTGKCLEVGGIAPQLILSKWLGVVKAHDQRGVNVVKETVEAIAHQHCRMPHKLREFAAVITRKNQQRPLVSVFAKAKAAFNQSLVHSEQDEPLVVSGETGHGRVVREVAAQDSLLL